MATQLKYKLRSGWDHKHWNVNKDRLESIAEHVYGTCILAIAIDSELDLDLDMGKVMKMLVLHEIGEVVIGDVTPFDNLTRDEKLRVEHKAMRRVLGDLLKGDGYYDLLVEFDKHKSKESVFAYYCDKLEADIQAKVYQDMGCQRDMSDQADNVILKNEGIKKILKSGAGSVFEVWYEWNKPIYESEVFMELLNYIKDNKMLVGEVE